MKWFDKELDMLLLYVELFKGNIFDSDVVKKLFFDLVLIFSLKFVIFFELVCFVFDFNMVVDEFEVLFN